jgi:hypothetical protein
METKEFYVYVYLDPRKKGLYVYGDYMFEYEPFYVGKGHGRRYKRHLNKSNYNGSKTHKNNRIKFLIENNYNIEIVKVKENLLESDAFILEMELIREIGRYDIGVGPLCNHTDGGEGSIGCERKTKGKTLEEIHGVEKAKEIRLKLSESHKSENPKPKKIPKPRHEWITNKGKTLEEIHGVEKAKILKDKIVKNLKINKKGDKLSIDTRKKISESLIGNTRRKNCKHSEETKKQISETKKGTLSWNATPVLQLSKDGELIKEWVSATAAAKELGLSQGNIWTVINGGRNTCGGYKWKLK